jgi:hypothetical protein
MSSLQVFIRVYRLEIQSVVLVFSTQLYELQYCLSNLLFSSPPPPESTVYNDSVWLGGGGGRVLSCVGDHILQEINTLNLTRFRTYKSFYTIPNKNLRWEGASDR